MKCPWNDPNDIYRYLNGSICMYDRQPVYVGADGADTTLTLYSLVGKNEVIKKINHDDPLFDVESPRLGYIERDGFVFYPVRTPQRQFSQGLTNRNVVFYEIDGRLSTKVHNKTLLTKEFRDMLLNHYRPFEESMDLLSSQKEVAFSRDIAMSSGGKSGDWPKWVYVKGLKVGYIIGNSRTVVVPSAANGSLISKMLSVFDWKIE